ncbi:MAG: hypothetical protein EOO28_13305 [Comamonadaceae bacterium]|nr:MAG: hypothetical protein EOO28_13305 [Comamonadaceae bacterium]
MTDSKDKAKAPAVDASALRAGHRVLEYRIDRILGGGGFGITYLAHDVNLDLPVALKEYFPGDLAQRGSDSSVSLRAGRGEDATQQYTWGLERFLDEARALASFRHPNIVRVLRYFRENGTAYIVMEYESGDPLKRWLARQTSFDQKALLKVVHPLLDGLESVHNTGFLHRDIKPDNIYMRADGSPVLLDFGAARRVNGDSDLTNVVSPGFAPFEQYHSRGNQGPWTDIYSLGAVMYWMTTGTKPMESAARVKSDVMPRAVDTANALGWGELLLRAIDWAMTPDENRRPQSVAEFRKALDASEDAPGATGGLPGGARTLQGASVNSAPSSSIPSSSLPVPSVPVSSVPVHSVPVSSVPSSSLSASQSAAHPDSLRRNVMGTIMFLDLVGYSTHSVSHQVLLKTRFNELLTKVLRSIDETSRITVDTGDGAAVCFLGDPEEALQSALLMRDLLVATYRGVLLRIGLHLGPVRVLYDINERVNVVGDGINVAQRIMDFARPNQVVVSRAYYDVISRIADNTANLFRHLGPHLDKHLRSHDIYAVLDANAQPPQPRTRPTDFDHTAPHRVMMTSLTPALTHEIENDLARLIGPLARVLVKKTVFKASSAQSLRDLLAPSIPDGAAREAFVNPKLANSRVSGNSVSRPNSTPVFSRPGSARPDSVSQPVSNREVSRPVNSGRSLDVTAEQLAQLERVLSLHIGPMAKMLVRKEAARHLGYDELLTSLAGHIDRQADRNTFLSACRTASRG